MKLTFYVSQNQVDTQFSLKGLLELTKKHESLRIVIRGFASLYQGGFEYIK